jgi:hypothetical protein
MVEIVVAALYAKVLMDVKEVDGIAELHPNIATLQGLLRQSLSNLQNLAIVAAGVAAFGLFNIDYITACVITILVLHMVSYPINIKMKKTLVRITLELDQIS